jgi:hypothetical protein
VNDAAGHGSGQLAAIETSRQMVDSPGVRFYLALAIAIVFILDAASRGSVVMVFAALLVWLVFVVNWFVRFAFAVPWAPRRLSGAEWCRWLAIPAILAIGFALFRSSVPSDVRFAISRGAMDRAAAEIMAGGSTDRGWIGLYPMREIERRPEGVTFVVADNLLWTTGFVYVPAGQPLSVNGDAYEPLDGGWWTWEAVSLGSHKLRTDGAP